MDDFALKKRYTYGTVMVDWDTHRIVDMIQSRESNEVCQWLSTYPNITIISRDGSSGYASAAARAHPDAIQVTDRFHLIKNLSDLIDRYIKNTFPSRVEIEATSEPTEEMNCLYNTANRSQRIRYAHTKHKEGLTMQEIAYLLHTSAGTVRKYLAIPENEIPEDKHIVRERQHQEAIRKKEDEMKRVRKLYEEGMCIEEISRITHHVVTLKSYKLYSNPSEP